MRKIHLLTTITAIFTVATIAPAFNAFADTPKVLTVDAEISQTISYSGTTEEGVLAVSCGLYDAEDTELEFNSVAVLDEAFAGEFAAHEDAVFIRCANYDGGTIVEKTLTSETQEEAEEEEDEDDANIPNTGALTSSNTGIAKEVTIFTAASIVVLTAIIIFTVRAYTKRIK